MYNTITNDLQPVQNGHMTAIEQPQISQSILLLYYGDRNNQRMGENTIVKKDQKNSESL